MKKQKKIVLKNFFYVITIMILIGGTFCNRLWFIKPILANAEQMPVEEEDIFYKEADLFDYDRWDWNFANCCDAWFYIQIKQSECLLRLAVDEEDHVYLAEKENGDKHQIWRFDYNSENNAFIIENVGTNRVLYQTGFHVGDDIKSVSVENFDKRSANANWKIFSNNENRFHISSSANVDLVLEAESDDPSLPQENSSLCLGNDEKTNNQRWDLFPASLDTYDRALLYKPFHGAETGEADYNNLGVTTNIVKNELSGKEANPEFNSPIGNLFSFFYNSDYSKYNDAGTYNGYANYGGLKPYESAALRDYRMPYIMHDNGWYEFDSSKYYVVKDDEQKKFLLYDRSISGNIQKVVSDDRESEGFFPFNGEGVTEANYGFGMKTQLDFTYVDGGYVKYIDEDDEKKSIQSQAMEFKFSGDDDLWVFVDGKLILDVGGIHGRTEGSINFATKKSYVGEVEQMDFHALFDDSKQKHTLSIFYLERCPYESNLKIMFNLLMERQITYHSNDGKNRVSQESVINEPRVSVKDNMFGEREDYIFKGWNTKADGSGVFAAPNSEVVLKKDLQYFAQWEKKAEILYTITLEGNGGELKTTAYNNKDTERNNKIYVNYVKNKYHIYTYDTHVQVHKNNVQESSYKAIKEGYTFQGFYTKQKGGRQMISSSGEILVDANTFTEDTTLYAQWTPNTDTKYIVNHWIQNIRSDANSYNSIHYTLKETEHLTGTTDSFVMPQIKEYIGFTYASAKGANEERVDAPQVPNVLIEGDGTTVIDCYYTRNYYRVGGYLPLSNIPVLEITKGNGIESTTGSGLYQYEEDVTVSAVCRQGYHWDINDDVYPSSWSVLFDILDVNMNNSIVTFTMPANDIYFQVTATNNRYKVIFDDNGGYFGPDEMELFYDKASSLPYPPTRVGFDFLRWTVGNKSYYVGQSVKNLTSIQNGQVIMTAQWKQKRFQLIKIASSMHGKTMVKRTVGDYDWYHSTGKWTLKQFYNIPKEKCVQKWNINEEGIIKRVC